MKISTDSNQQNFTGKFINTKSFQEVVKYAEKVKRLPELDTALNRLNSVKTEDILLIHGKSGDRVFSNFNMGKRAIQNLGAATPEEASFNAILELGELGRKFRRLVGGEAASKLTADDVIKKYGV